MSIFICELCDKITDSDTEECDEYMDGLICESCMYELAEMMAARADMYEDERQTWVT